MKIKPNMNLPYSYQLCLALASDVVKMSDLKKEIEKSIEIFNIRSAIARNVKQIESYEVKDDFLFIILNSNNSMNSPTRGLYLLSKLVMEELGKRENGKYLVNSVVMNRSFFKGIGETHEIKNLNVINQDNVNIKKNDEVERMSIEELFEVVQKLKKRVDKLEEIIKIK